MGTFTRALLGATCVAVVLGLTGCDITGADSGPNTSTVASALPSSPQPFLVTPAERVTNVVRDASGKLKCNPTMSAPVVLPLNQSKKVAGNGLTVQLDNEGVKIFSGNVVPGASLILNGKLAGTVPSLMQQQKHAMLSKWMLLSADDWGQFNENDELVLCTPVLRKQ